MASLVEILNLDKVQASIKKIDLYLVSQVKLSEEYIKALAYKAIILHTIGKSNEALKLLLQYVPDIKLMANNAVIALCDAIIEICIDVMRFDQVEKYIEIKRNYLPISKLHLYIKDRIKLSLAKHEYQGAKELLIKYLNDDISKEEEIFAKEELARIYYNEHQYDEYLETIKALEEYYQKNVSLDNLSKLDISKLKISYIKGNYVKVVTEGNRIITELPKEEYMLLCASLMIKSYVALNDYKKASIIESIYEEYISNDHPKESLEFAYAAKELYTKTNTLVSINEYSFRIKELEEILAPESKKKRKPKKQEDEIVIPNIELDEISPVDVVGSKMEIINPIPIKNKPEVKIEERITKIKDVIVSENYNNLEGIFNAINDLDINAKFREVFRITMLELQKRFPIEEAYLLYYKRQYLGIHYKKERAYDKKLEFEDLENTIEYQAMESDNEEFLDLSDQTYNKNIVTGINYEDIIYAYAIPLHDSKEVIGSLTFIANKPFLDKEMVYESLKLITGLINTRLLTSIMQDDLEYNNKKIFFIRDKMSSGLKEEIDSYLHFSQRAIDILGVMENLTINDYYNNMKSNDIAEYKRIHDMLYQSLKEDLEFEYDFNKNGNWIRVRERFYPMLNDGVIHIYSLIDDITSYDNDKKKLIDLAYTNPISKMQTEVKLVVDLAKYYPNKKLALCIFEIKDFRLYKEIYGYNFGNQIIYTVGQEFLNAFSNDFNTFIYHIESDRFAILFSDINDKRIIENKLNKAFEYVSKALNRLNSRVNLVFVSGTYRLGKNIKLDNSALILTYATEALYDATLVDDIGHTISFYDSEVSKKRFMQSSLVTHISEAIDSGKLGLTYHQIVNLSSMDVYGYTVRVNLDNYDVDYENMNQVITRRGITKRVEKYTISSLFKELKMFYEECGGYLTAFVNVSDITIDEAFFDYIMGLLQFYKLKPEFIVFMVRSAKNKALALLRQRGFMICSLDILDVYRNSCDYYLYDFYEASRDSILEIRALCKNHSAKCILFNMDTKNDIELARNNGYDLITGKFYKKEARIKALIEKVKKIA